MENAPRLPFDLGGGLPGQFLELRIGIDDAFAAVTVPSFAKAGLSVEILSMFALNGCSS